MRILSPISIACENDYTDAVELLLKHGADPNTIADDGKCRDRRPHSYDDSIDMITTLLDIAYRHGNTCIIKLLMDYGIDPNSTIYSRYHGNALSLLTTAISDGYADIANLALKYGATYTRQTMTPLYSDIDYNHTEMIKAIMPYLSDTIIYQCACFAVENNKPDILDYILASGRIGTDLKIGGIDAITIAINNNYTDVVDVLTNLPTTDIEQC